MSTRLPTQLTQAPSVTAKENSRFITFPFTQAETLVSPTGYRAYPKYNRDYNQILFKENKQNWEKERKRKWHKEKEIPWKKMNRTETTNRVLFTDHETALENITVSSSENLTSGAGLPLNYFM